MAKFLNTTPTSVFNEHQEQYEKIFENAVLNASIEDNMIKVLQAPMRWGKTNTMIKHHVPFIFKNTNCNLIILAMPRMGIIEEKEMLFRKTAIAEGFQYFNTPEIQTIEKCLKNGIKVAVNTSNQGAWVKSKLNKFFAKVDKTKTAILQDEVHVGSVDDPVNTEAVTGRSASKYGAKMYKGFEQFRKYTPYLFSFTATPNKQHVGIVPTVKDLQYKVLNDRVNINVMNGRIGWIDNERIHYWTEKKSVLSNLSVYDAANMMFEEMSSLELELGLKRCAIVEVGHTSSKKDIQIDEFIELIKDSKEISKIASKEDYVGAVLKSDGSYLFNLNGQLKYSDDGDHVTEELITKKLNDIDDPLRFMLVIEMGKLGVSYPLVQILFSCRTTNRFSRKTGYITESKNQLFGRPTTPNPGRMTQEEFFDKYDGNFGNIPDFDPRINTMSFYLNESNTNLAAMIEFQEFFAPKVPEQYDSEEYVQCPCCNGFGLRKNHSDQNINQEKLNSILGID